MRVLIHAVAVAALLWTPVRALANAPAPWWACENKAEGDSCNPYGADKGRCELQDSCTDDDQTTVNECLYCIADDEEGGCTALPMGVNGTAGLVLVAAIAGRLRRRR